jgi:hypothetical protein
MVLGAKDMRHKANTKIRTRIVAALGKEFGIKFEQDAFIRFGDDRQGAGIWLPIASDFLTPIPNAAIELPTRASRP